MKRIWEVFYSRHYKSTSSPPAARGSSSDGLCWRRPLLPHKCSPSLQTRSVRPEDRGQGPPYLRCLRCSARPPGPRSPSQGGRTVWTPGARATRRRRSLSWDFQHCTDLLFDLGKGWTSKIHQTTYILLLLSVSRYTKQPADNKVPSNLPMSEEKIQVRVAWYFPNWR